MLKLKKIQMLGFKSFCDRTEVTLPGQGIAVVVGPNGCGKSNILDAVSWVLGEQSAKTLRGGKMEDVIFAGTRERKPLGMAEVSLSLIDPEAYTEGPLLDSLEGPEDAPPETDWDEEKLRNERSAETEEIIAEAQPGSVKEDAGGEGGEPGPQPGPESSPEHPVIETAAAAAGNPVVLKVRRRRFQRAARQGEIVVTRRLFRTGESEYLLNGKLCRLRDIQDIFMGTGLGPESYAIIEQERIGQLLSSKPHDRRAIIEEAAGITRFKSKKRLSELRLEQAKQNLSRVDDIFEEVTRQMGSLKRQAQKAERYAALRDEMRARLRVVLASRITQMDREQAALIEEIASLGSQIEQGAGQVSGLEAEYSSGTARGYQLDSSAKEASTRANQASVELERAATREVANQERIAELRSRAAGGAAELEQAKLHLQGLVVERESHRSFLETAAAEAAGVRESSRSRQAQAREASEAVHAAEQRLEAARRYAMQLLTQAGLARNQTMQAEESLLALERDADRLAGEISSASSELASLGSERGQASLKFESVTEQLQRLESDLAILRAESETRRSEETATKTDADRLRAEMATLTGRRNSLESLIREHSYSTDTVRNLLKSNSLGGGLAPVGTLADFLEVGDEYETVVDSFLRDELNYIVVKSWDAAHEGMRLLKSDVDGRATFLVHPDDSQAKFSFAGDTHEDQHSTAGVKRLKDCIRVLNGFGRSLEVILPKLRDGFVTPDAELAKSLALENPNAFFLAPSGECFHNVTVTGGKPRAEGPLALKGELRETQKKLDLVEAKLAETEMKAASLTRLLRELTGRSESIAEERRGAERESANQSAALRQMEAEVARLERRLHDWVVQSERNKDLRGVRQGAIETQRDEASRLEGEHASAEIKVNELQQSMEELRLRREEAQQHAAAVAAELAGLEERSRGAEAAFTRIDRMYGELERRVNQIEEQLASANAEEQHRMRENEQLAVERERLAEIRSSGLEQAAQATEEARVLREQLAELEHNLKALRGELDALREARAARSAHSAKLAVELEYMEAACVSDLGIEASELRQQDDLVRLEGDALGQEDEACRGFKQKLEAMGPVNMMALEEYQETAERHGFLESQRKDLIDAIENTQSTIREIDQITRQKFDEAFVRINQNFSQTFIGLFGGGQGFMRLTDEENTAESGIDIVASPPGKKLQNVLLLSGGEKALTALALLVGIFQYTPSPFCVLDEVDAPLDEANVGRLAGMLATMSGETQFLLVTHSKRMMTEADLIYGVTMQEQGVSKLVSVRLSEETTRARERTQERRLVSA
ncbi:MAG: chromosome segregation protein SMC [Acidobacteriaceae bacterium]